MWTFLMCYLIFGEMLMVLGLYIPGVHTRVQRTQHLAFLFPACMVCLVIWPVFVYRAFKR